MFTRRQAVAAEGLLPLLLPVPPPLQPQVPPGHQAQEEVPVDELEEKLEEVPVEGLVELQEKTNQRHHHH